MICLSSARDVIQHLGGPRAVARMFGVRPSAVSNWSQAGVFPPKTFLLIVQKLEDQGHTAPHSLWDFAAENEVRQ